jgi:hypothetical protein
MLTSNTNENPLIVTSCRNCVIFTETAINIGYSSRLLTEDMEEVYIIDGDTADTVSKQLQDALKDIAEKSTDDIIVASKSEGKRSGRVSPLSNDFDNFALVVNGCSLVSRRFVCHTPFVMRAVKGNLYTLRSIRESMEVVNYYFAGHDCKC